MTRLYVDLFCTLYSAVTQGTPMRPRSPSDKEYMAQDWFAEQARKVQGVSVYPQGRNSYPDFWIERLGEKEGYEIKSLEFTMKGRPARKDLDFNSTIPSGTRQGLPVFLVFFLYTGRGMEPRAVHTLIMTHGDLINADTEIAELHQNVAIHGFGSFGDGFIRDRKMYVLPHPATIYPAGLGQVRLTVPSDWEVTDRRLQKVDRIERTIVKDRLVRYSVSLKKKPPSSKTEPAPNAQARRDFDVYAPI